MSTPGTSSVWTAVPQWQDSVAPLPCRPHGFTHVLILGGPRAWRMRVAVRCHREGVLRRGPFVPLTGPSHDARLCRAIETRLLGVMPRGFDDPLVRSEGGTLFLDEIDRLSPLTQRRMLAFLDLLPLTSLDPPGGWAGRVVAGCVMAPGRGPNADRLLVPLFDALDKIRIEFPSAPPQVAHSS